jgi:hypothetical protein
MRLFLLASAIATLSGASLAAGPTPVGTMPVLNPNARAPDSCPPISRYEAMKRGKKLGPQKLDELPAADLYKSVYRKIGGCVVPIIVGYGFGMERSGKPAK